MRIYFAIIGGLLVILSAYLFIRRVSTQLYGATTSGVVVRIETREVDQSISYHPVVKYVDVTGTQHFFTSNSGVSATAFPVGTQVPVQYSTSNPSIAYIASFRDMWAPPIAFLFLGVMGLWAALHLN